MIVQLYADGIMQQTEDWRFTVLQGSCVGGSTTVNNAVCFDPPPERCSRAGTTGVRRRARPRPPAREREAVGPSSASCRRPDAVLNPSGRRYVRWRREAAGRRRSTPTSSARTSRAASARATATSAASGARSSRCSRPRCRGRSATFGTSVRIVADCEVERIVTRSGQPQAGRGSAREARRRPRRDRAGADSTSSSAGAVASSYLLLRSGAGRGLPVGKGFCCNMGAPLTAEFDGEPLNAYDGLQISHYGIPRQDGLRVRDLVQPAGLAGAQHAGLVRAALREHAPLRPPDGGRRARRHRRATAAIGAR